MLDLAKNKSAFLLVFLIACSSGQNTKRSGSFLAADDDGGGPSTSSSIPSTSSSSSSTPTSDSGSSPSSVDEGSGEGQGSSYISVDENGGVAIQFTMIARPAKNISTNSPSTSDGRGSTSDNSAQLSAFYERQSLTAKIEEIARKEANILSDGRKTRSALSPARDVPSFNPADYPFSTDRNSGEGQKLAQAFLYEKATIKSYDSKDAKSTQKTALLNAAHESLMAADKFFQALDIVKGNFALDLANTMFDAIVSDFGAFSRNVFEAVNGLSFFNGKSLGVDGRGAAIALACAPLVIPAGILGAAEVAPVIGLSVAIGIMGAVLHSINPDDPALAGVLSIANKVNQDAQTKVDQAKERGEGDESVSHAAEEEAKTIRAADEIGVKGKAITGEEANKPYTDKNWAPPYPDNAAVIDGVIETQSEEPVLVRFTDKKGDPKGRWAVPVEDVEGMTPEQIKDHLALPSQPTDYTLVNPPAGTPVRVGPVRGQPAFEGMPSGGGTQVEFLDHVPEENWTLPKELGDTFHLPQK